MDLTERRAILEAIARDPKAYPRDKINAVKAMAALDKLAEKGESKPETVEDDLDRLIAA